MAWKEMQVAPIVGGYNKFGYEASETLSAAGDGTSFLVPPGVSGIAATLTFTTSGSGKIQTSTDSVVNVKSGSATWIDWDLGEVSTSKQGVCDPVTAIRLVQIHSGTATITLRAN